MEMEGHRGDTLMGCVIQCIGRGFEQKRSTDVSPRSPRSPRSPFLHAGDVFRCNARDGNHRWFKDYRASTSPLPQRQRAGPVAPLT